MITAYESGRDLTDEQWAVSQPLLPKGAKARRPAAWSRRLLIDGGRVGPDPDLFRRWHRAVRALLRSAAEVRRDGARVLGAIES